MTFLASKRVLTLYGIINQSFYFSSIDYENNGKWANANNSCSDPKEVLENAVYKQEEAIKDARIAYFDDDGSGSTAISWYPIDLSVKDGRGRCFTMHLGNH